MAEIRTGLENQEKKIVNYLFRKKYTPQDILAAGLNSSLRLNPKYVKKAIREHEKREYVIKKTLVSILLASSLNIGTITSNQQPQDCEEDIQEIEIPSEPSEYVRGDNYQFTDLIGNSVSQEYSDKEMKKTIEVFQDYINNSNK